MATRKRRKRTLPPNVRRHHSGYRAVFQHEGKRYRGPVCDSVDLAVAWMEGARRAASSSRPTVPVLSVAWDMLDADLETSAAKEGTLAYYRKQRARLERHFPSSMPLQAIDETMIQAYARERVRSGVSAGTVHYKELQALGRALALAERARLIARNPIRGMRKPSQRNKRFDMIPQEQIDAIVATMRAWPRKLASLERDADVVEVFFASGLRRAELGRLQVRHVDLDGNRIDVAGKTQDSFLPIAPRALEPLRRLCAGKGPRELVVTPVKGKRPISDSTRLIEKLFERWSKRLERQGKFSPHVLRHSFGTALAKAGTPQWTLQQLMRHSDPRMTSKYVHELSEETRAALAQLGDPGPASPAPSPGPQLRESADPD